ncbi:MAG TPA: M1 family metallopeptidase [Planctomycetota bacterium]|nr:M1 family metallopeptidase [Planctomycetota bacterium]
MSSRGLPLLLLLATILAAQEPHFAADRPLDLLHLRLEASVDLEKKTLAGHATLDFAALRPGRVVKVDAVGLDIRSAQLADRAAEASYDGKTLEFVLDSPLELGEAVRMTVDYTCTDPDEGLYFRGPTPAEPDVPWQVWSQGETHENCHWIPLPDQPNERMTSELLVTAKEGLQVLSNGRLESRKPNGDGTETWHYVQGGDHAPYLITLVVGTFEVIREDWRGKPVEYWVPPGRGEDARRSFRNTPRMLEFFSEAFGPYAWDKYAQVVVEQFTHGGMENTSATTLTDRTLHDERAHLDYSSDWLVAHELAHQWFGDLLTCTDWAHVWLNEGFASYAEALWAEHDLGRDEYEYAMWDKRQPALDGGRKAPIVYRNYAGEWEQFDNRAYPKGAWVLHMLRCRLGEDLFWTALRRYVAERAHTCVETSDLRRSFEATTGRSLGRFFYDWTERAGHPVVQVRHDWDAEKGVAEVFVRQTQEGEPFQFPLRVEFRCGGKPFAIDVQVTAKEQRFLAPLPARPDMIRVDPDLTVLMELTEEKGRELWLAQLASDPGVAGRIRAAEALGRTRRDDDRTALGAALLKEPFWGVQKEIARDLGETGGDKSRDALLAAVALPNPKARRAVVEALGRFKSDPLVLAALEKIAIGGDPSCHVEAEAIKAYAGMRPKDGVARLTPLLARDSFNDVIREAVLGGLGGLLDPAATDVLIAWTARGKPRACRGAALDGLATLATACVLDGAQTARVVETAQACLEKTESPRVKARAADTLRALGQQASPALGALEAIAEHDPAENVRKSAKDAIERIRSGAPPQVELARLREDLQKVRDENRALRERIDRIDGKMPVKPPG